jgi:hypothetical protein
MSPSHEKTKKLFYVQGQFFCLGESLKEIKLFWLKNKEEKNQNPQKKQENLASWKRKSSSTPWFFSATDGERTHIIFLTIFFERLENVEEKNWNHLENKITYVKI